MDAATHSDRLAEALVSADMHEAEGDFTHLSAKQRAAVEQGLQRLHAGDVTGAHVLSTILDRQVRMPVYRLEDAQRAFATLARKAAERNLPVPTLTEVSRETVSVGERAETWVTCRILGAAPVLNGWRCVATLTMWGDKLIDYTADGETIDTADMSMRCDHCELHRRRNLVFVLRHEDGEEKLVGSTCLNDYLGTDALGAWFVWSRLHETARDIGGWSVLYDFDAHAEWLADHAAAACRGDGLALPPIPVADFIAACVAEIRAHGYVSGADAWKSRNDDNPRTATGRYVWTRYQTANHVAPTPADHTRAVAVVAWIDTLDRSDFDRDGDLRYTASLARAYDWTRDDGVAISNANMLASAVTAFARDEQRKAADGEWNNEHVPGNVDDAVVLDLVVRRSLGWALACADAAGRQVLVRKREYKTGGRVEIGDTIRVSGSIGGLNEYNGVAQTFISRPSVYRPTDTLSPAIRRKAAAMYERNGEPVPAWAQVSSRKGKK